MSNVLGNLFGEIANAIRAKTGGTGTMKPAEFPAEIANISVGGGGGELKFATSNFQGTEKAQTVNHTLGSIPDILIITTGALGTAGMIIACVAFSSAMLAALGGGYISTIRCATANGPLAFTSNIGMDLSQDNNFYEQFGGVRAVTADAFTIGSISYGMKSGEYHNWIAIGGITG